MSQRRQQGGSVTLLAVPAVSYCLYGRRVLSEVPLPIPVLPDDESATNDWIIRREDAAPPTISPVHRLVAEHLDADGSAIDRFYRSGSEGWLWDRQAGTCRLEPGAGRVTVYPVSDADEDDLGLLLIGPVASFMLHQSGYPNLHASAVVTPHGACAFMGPSTFGKSTLAAGLLRAGGHLVTDDILPLDFRRDGVYGVPGPPMMKVWSNTAQQTFGITADLPRLSSLTDKRLLELRRHHYSFVERAAYLRAIYVPQRYDPTRAARTDVRIQPLTPREAALALLSQTFRGHYLMPDELAVLLTQYTQLVKQARVAVVHLPHGLEYQDAVTERIVADLAAL